jgi:aspartate racemase
MRDRICGIVGGLGPEATIDLFQKILKNTPARKDQDHIPLIIYSNPKTPSRYEAILEEGESPVPYLVDAIKKLEGAGAEFIAIACNLAHHYYEELIREANVPILHIVKETVEFTAKNYDVRKVGVLAPTPTIKVGLYQRELRKAGYEVLTLDEDQTRNLIDEAIYSEKGIKAGFINENVEPVLKAIDLLVKKGAEVVILACTELPLISNYLDEEVKRKVIDPTDVLAKKIVTTSKSPR